MGKKLVLKSSVFFWETSYQGMLYDWTTSTSLRFSLLDPGILSICNQWKDLNNLYAAHFDEKEEQDWMRAFVSAVVEKGLGDVFEEEDPAISFPPVLKINQTLERMGTRGGLDTMPLLSFLSHLRVFLGGNCDVNSLWKQVVFPMATPEHIDEERLFAFLQRCDPRSLTQIDLVLSTWDAPYLSAIVDGLTSLNWKNNVRFYFAHSNPGFNNEALDRIASDGFALTQICTPGSLEQMQWINGRKYHLLVREERDLIFWTGYLGENPTIDYEFKPVADNNLEFFRNNVFLSEEEILSQKLSKKDIFRHQALNVNQFGTLCVFPDGTIHPAPDAPAIGTLEDSVHQTIIRELEENHAWRQTRDLMTPCKNCLYRYLCPSPSVYERIFGVPGCTYWKE